MLLLLLLGLLGFILLSLVSSSFLGSRLHGSLSGEGLPVDLLVIFLIPVDFGSHLVIKDEPGPILGVHRDVGFGILGKFLKSYKEDTVAALGVHFRVLGLNALPDGLAGRSYFAFVKGDHGGLDHFIV